MLPALLLVQNYDWVWQQRGCVISSHFQQISLITGYVLVQSGAPQSQAWVHSSTDRNHTNILWSTDLQKYDFFFHQHILTQKGMTKYHKLECKFNL